MQKKKITIVLSIVFLLIACDVLFCLFWNWNYEKDLALTKVRREKILEEFKVESSRKQAEVKADIKSIQKRKNINAAFQNLGKNLSPVTMDMIVIDLKFNNGLTYTTASVIADDIMQEQLEFLNIEREISDTKALRFELVLRIFDPFGLIIKKG